MAIVFRTRAEEIALGMTLLGLFFSSVLYGLALSQLYTYYKRFPRDPLSVKILVIATAILDTVSVVLECHACWFDKFDSIHEGILIFNSWQAELAVSMFISGIAEAFMTYRVWMRKPYQSYPMFARFNGILYFVSACYISSVAKCPPPNFWNLVPSVLRLGSASLCDTGIAVSLCYFLQKKRTGYKRTDEIIDHLMLFSINSGLITSVASISCLITNGDNDMDTPVLPRFTRGLSKAISEKNTGRSRPTQIDVFVVTETLTTSDDIHHSSSKATSRSSILSSQLKDEISSNPNLRPALCNESGSFSNFSTSSSGSVQEGIKEIPRVVIRG
ncbi:hypothetical protein EV360DRAFT_67230 [Lentinula raphanica]|nr:hypothetical protein EV360DRAFT_67230 [Lentinula raphanica]